MINKTQSTDTSPIRRLTHDVIFMIKEGCISRFDNYWNIVILTSKHIEGDLTNKNIL